LPIEATKIRSIIRGLENKRYQKSRTNGRARFYQDSNETWDRDPIREGRGKWEKLPVQGGREKKIKVTRRQ